MDHKTIAHARWNCMYYIIFIPKYRRKIIYGLRGGSDRQRFRRRNKGDIYRR